MLHVHVLHWVRACVRVCVEFHGHVSLCTPWKIYVVYLML